MGFLKDLRSLSTMSNEMRAQTDTKAVTANALAQMQTMNQHLSALTDHAAQAATVAADGVMGTATITAARQTGSFVNHAPVVELELLVTVPGKAPVPVSRRELVPMLSLGKAQVGNQVQVKVSASDPTALFVVWG